MSIDKYRYNHRQNRNNGVSISEIDYEIYYKDDVEDKILEKLLIDEINDYICNLDIESQTIFIRRYFLFKDLNTISNRFEMSENNVKVKLFRIRKNFKKHLEKRGYIFEKN